MGGQIHNILMDEFKKAHQKMFKNGYVENEYQQSNGKNDEMDKIAALDNNEHKLEVSGWRTISSLTYGNRSRSFAYVHNDGAGILRGER